MDIWNKFERKFGKYAVKNLTLYVLACYAVGYVVSLISPNLLLYFTLEPALILKGQIWRLVSWVIIPPTNGLIYVIFMMMLYYSLGRSLEYAWGAFRYNVYIFSGMLFTIIGAFVAYGISVLQYGGSVVGMGYYVSTYYINMSIFLACAAIVPDLQLYFWGIIPIRMKWLAILDAVLIGIDWIQGSMITKVIIIASLLNFLLFFMMNRNARRFHPKQIKRRKQFQQQAARPIHTYENGAKHKCAVCGRTELDAPELEFRYCSKCNGNYEYCSEHLFTHEHKK